MAFISYANLSITIDAGSDKAHPVVRCRVRFSPLELCMMRACKGTRMFKLRCQLWGEDGGLRGGDDCLYTYRDIFYFPDTSPNMIESRTFEATIDEGLLDEDKRFLIFGDEVDDVYGKLILYNYFTGRVVTRKTNVIHHEF